MPPALLALAAAALFPLPAQDEVEKALERLKTEDAAEQRKALDDLARHGAAAVAAAIRTLDNLHPGMAERVAGLVRQLASRKWKERDEAMQALVRLGRYAKVALSEHANAGDPETAWRVKTALAEIQERAAREEILEEHRNAALCDFLGAAGDGRAVKTLARLAGSAPARVQVRAAEALGRLRGAMGRAQADEAADRLLEMLEKNRDARARTSAIRSLGMLKSEAAVRPLSGLLADRSEKNLHVKRTCMAALVAVGGPEALRAVIGALGTDDVYLREGAVAALEPAAGDAFGFDPRLGPAENRAAVERFQAWWSKKFARPWE